MKVSTTFFVWNPKGGQWRKKHETYDEAKTEAERLARENPGQDFFVLGALGVARVEPYPQTYTPFCIEEGMPF